MMKDASRYTKAADGELIDIAAVDPSNRYARGPYRCLSCNHIMVPALGSVRKHHFKHKSERPLNCSNETYLHQIGKITLFNTLSDCMKYKKPFLLNRRQPIVCNHYEENFGLICRDQTTYFADDLAGRFDVVEIEKSIAGFVADVLLTSSQTGEKFLIEIAVTHEISQEKISSGLGVVEIKINCEDDVEELKKGISTSSANVNCYHLPDVAPANKRCVDPCNIPCTLLLLYDSGKAWYSHTTSTEAKYLISDRSLISWEVAPTHFAGDKRSQRSFLDLFKQFILKQKFHDGHIVRSCMLCRHNAGQRTAHDIYCNDRGRNVWMSSSACGCQSYAPATDAEEAKVLLDYKLNGLP